MGNLRQCIHIDGRCIEDILRLPCVKGCEKTSVAGVYQFKFYPKKMADSKTHLRAYTGDWLCQDNGSLWHVLSENQYKELVK